MEYRYEERDRGLRIWKDRKRQKWNCIDKDPVHETDKGKGGYRGGHRRQGEGIRG